MWTIFLLAGSNLLIATVPFSMLEAEPRIKSGVTGK
jgi:hypothetical protein